MGALCGKLLGDMGWTSSKSNLRKATGPLRAALAKGHAHREGSLRFAYLNAGKRSITLDITKPHGKRLLLRLVKSADIVLETFAPGFLASHNLGYSDLIEMQNKLILASLTGFGQDGPYAHFKAPDIVGTAMGGLLYISGDPKMAPAIRRKLNRITMPVYSLPTALPWLSGSGRPEASARTLTLPFKASMALHEHVAFNYSAEGRVMKRAGSQHQHNAPANLFECKNGYIALFVTQAHWPLLLKSLGRSRAGARRSQMDQQQPAAC